MPEQIIGKVTHFFPKISVAVIELEADIKDGDRIKFVKGEESFAEAKAGMSIGLKTEKPAAVGAVVYKL